MVQTLRTINNEGTNGRNASVLLLSVEIWKDAWIVWVAISFDSRNDRFGLFLWSDAEQPEKYYAILSVDPKK